MAAPDPGYVRMYNSRREWTANAAKRQAKSLAQDLDSLRRDLDRGDKVFASQARVLADGATQLVERLAALEAFDEVSYLTTDPDAEKA